VDYGARRRAMKGWTIPDPDWEHLVPQLPKAGRARDHNRQRNIVSALIWVMVTQGEHRFAPHRRSPDGYRPGTPEDRGLDIDRAWWRSRNDTPGWHYPELDRVCGEHAADLSWRIDHPLIAVLD
jgi:hypothetical protein